MAPFPEDVDVFTIPHSRMKTLVESYYDLLSATNFSNDIDLKALLMSLAQTFYEFKAHEQIENEYIMARLKAKLKALSITNNAVCNCHADNRLSDILDLLDKGYKLLMNDRHNYEMQLRSALKEFTDHFLPHMKQEEEIFQPLLIKYFTRDELRDLKQRVLTEHVLKREEAQEAKYQAFEKQTLDNEKRVESPQLSVVDLPPEVMVKIFTYLDPRDLCRCAQVCQEWSEIAMESQLWREITPVQWAKGEWNFRTPDNEDVEVDDDEIATDTYVYIDEDADIDESTDSDCSDCSNYSDVAQQIRKEAKILTGLSKYLLPKVGHGVEKLVLSHSKGITNSLFHKIVQHCPNIEVLSLMQTRITDTAFKSFGKTIYLPKLKKLELSGCVNVTDTTLLRLDSCMKKSPHTPINCQKTKKPNGSNCKKNQKRQCNDNDPVCESCTENTCSVDENCFKQSRQESEKDIDSTCQNTAPPGDGQCHSSCCEQSRGDNSRPVNIEECGVAMATSSDICCQLLTDRTLEHLDLSGCHLLTDEGLSYLAQRGLPFIRHLDLSGCMSLTGDGLHQLVNVCPQLVHENFYYCDNITDGPFAETASGCRNVDCPTRVCCRALLN